MIKEKVKQKLPFLHDVEWTQVKFGDFLKTALLLLIAAAIGHGLMWLSNAGGRPLTYNASTLFILATLIASLYYGLAPGLFAAAASFIGYHFFFQYPKLNFMLDTTNEGVSLTLFIVSALLAAFIGSRSRKRLHILQQREQRMTALHHLYEYLVLSDNKESMVVTLQEGIENILKTRATIFLPDIYGDMAPSLAAMEGSSQEDRDIVLESWEKEIPTESDTRVASLRKPPPDIYSLPLINVGGCIGVLAIHISGMEAFGKAEKQLTQLLADQAAIAIERMQLARVMENERNQKEKEELRTALLSSVTHDLKTPLVSIIGSLSAILRMPDKFNKEDQLKLIETSHDEAERLNSFISNILSMTKLESGSIALHKEWVSVDILMNSVLKRMKHRVKNHAITQKGRPIEILVDDTMIEQVLQNLLDNAVKYSPAQSDILIETSLDNKGGLIHIIDQGKGVPVDVREKIFDKFFRISKRDHRIAGTGLGLSICKTIVAAHGGAITVSDNPKQKGELTGSIFTIQLPEAREIQETKPKSEVA
jgi:two-component system sensor histidine kinase KdpD